MLKRRGRGWAACYLKVGMLRSQDASSAIVELKQDGSLVVLVGSVEVGAGTTTVAAQIAAEVLGVISRPSPLSMATPKRRPMTAAPWEAAAPT